MAYRYGKESQRKLETCHDDIQMIMNEAIKILDISILEGHRPKDVQNDLFSKGLTKVKYPDGKHNTTPSMAVDAVPYPVDWKDYSRFYWMAGICVGIAHELYEEGHIGHKLRYGGDWDRDGDIRDQKFNDLPHLELYVPE